MLDSCLKDGKHEDAEEFLGLYLDALDEELIELYTYISTNKPASTPSVEELGEGTQSAKGQTEGKRDYTVRRLFFLSAMSFGVADVGMDTNRQVQLSRPSRAYSVEGPVRRYACQTSLTLLLSKPGDHSNSISRSVLLLSPPPNVLVTNLFAQPDSVHTIQDALAHITQRQLVQTGQSGSSDASQEMLLETLSPVLVLHLERFLYDAAADGIVKISKFIQFAPGLEIPVGTIISFVLPVLAKAKNSSWLFLAQKSWPPFLGNLQSRYTTSCMGCFTTTGSPQAAGTIRSTFSI